LFIIERKVKIRANNILERTFIEKLIALAMICKFKEWRFRKSQNLWDWRGEFRLLWDVL